MLRSLALVVAVVFLLLIQYDAVSVDFDRPTWFIQAGGVYLLLFLLVIDYRR